MNETTVTGAPSQTRPEPKPRHADLRTFRRILGVFRPYRGRALLVLLTIVLTTCLGLVSPFLIKAIFDDAIAHKNMRHLIIYAALMFIVPVLANLLSSGQSVLNVQIGQSVMRDFRIKLFNHLQRMSLRFYTATQAGEIQSRLTNDVNSVREVVTNTVPGVVGNISTVGSAVIAMACISPVLTLLSFGLMPVFIVITLRAGRMRREVSRERQQTLATLSNIIYETLSINGILLVKTFGRQNQSAEQFERQSDKLVEVELRQQRITQWISLGFGTIFSAIPAAVYLLAGWQMIGGIHVLGAGMTAGTLVAFTALQGRFFGPAAQLLGSQADIHAALAVFDRIFEYLDLPVDIVERPGAVQMIPARVRGEVCFSDVSFTYRSDSEVNGIFRPALKRISFRADPGKAVALVGPSGAGKTTIAYLVPRLYEADSGVVSIDGHDVRNVSIASLAGAVSVVTQETYLLHASIRENLLYARLDASEADMISAAKDAAIHDRIMECEHGYDTLIGERGYKLSGGEKQRLAIARSILKDPRILILDEATSALDARSERLVQEALDRLMRGRTTIAIAHRLSTIVKADTILFVDGGEIVERGTHAELLALDGAYAELYRQQFAFEKDAILEIIQEQGSLPRRMSA